MKICFEDINVGFTTLIKDVVISDSGVINAYDTKMKLKLMLDSLKNRTYESLLLADQDYEHRLTESKEARKKYECLSLNIDDKNIIENLLACEDDQNWDKVVTGYMAGILDGYDLLKSFGLTKE